jgi:formylmethanofuran dehydrogenase subunit A
MSGSPGTIRIRGGAVHDPARGTRGEVADICIADGRVVASLPPGAPEFDARGLVVLPGGVDLHSHIAGPAVRAARLLCPESAGTCLPTLRDTGHRYARMGYTTVFDAAVSPVGARAAHDELDALPILDKGVYLLAANHTLALRYIREGRADRLRALLDWMLRSARGYALKIVNPGAAAEWTHGVPPAPPDVLLRAFADAATALRLPHPIHVHLNGLGEPGNATTTLRLMQSLADRPAHFTHLQFHAYGGRTHAGLRSRAPEIAAWLNAHPSATADVGQVVFGPAVTLSADATAQHRLHRATGRKWLNLDIEAESGCGIVPHDYRADRLTSAVQWATGLELMLLCTDPWRLFLTTDHPNGGAFTSYPMIIRMLMDRPFRDALVAAAHPRLGARTALAGIGREYTLDEIAVVTRAGPARALGLARKGHLGPGADGDVALYRRTPDVEAMFGSAVALFKDGRLVVREGDIVEEPAGRTFYATPATGIAPAPGDDRTAADLRDDLAACSSVRIEDLVIAEEALRRPEPIPPLSGAGRGMGGA